MAIQLRQVAGHSVASGQSRVTVSLESPTVEGNLVVIVAAHVHSSYGSWPLYAPAGFTLARSKRVDELTTAVWYQTAAPAMPSVTVYSTGEGSLQVQVLEYPAMAQASALDKASINGDTDRYPHSHTTGTTTQADEVVVGVIANAYGSTTQSGFTGGLTRVVESLSPTRTRDGDIDADDRRTRMTVHQAITTSVGSFELSGRLSTSRDWVAVAVTFKGGTTGPARMTSLNAPAMVTTGGGGDLTVFGPLRSLNAPAMITTGGSGRIGPFERQFRLGGWTGLLIGEDTPYRVESVEGLGGWDVRTSDGDFPRGDGAQRGVDLQSSRQMLFTVNFHGQPADLEAAMTDLLAALVPQRDTDWELMFRLPGRPLQQVRCRPTQLARELNARQMILTTQSFALRAADPRIYSAKLQEVEIPVSPAGTSVVTSVSATNEGNARAYPVIRIENRDTVDVTGVQLVNVSADVAFEVALVLPPGGQLVGDMPARITAAPRSVVTLDGQTKYGSWQPPREPFYLAPDPVATSGINALYLRTTPAGANVRATIEYRDTSAG